jgi:hypothetical protein
MARIMTNAERARLLKNSYVRNATPHSIQFTEEGKRVIWKRVLEGKPCIKVLLEDIGLPPINHVYDIAGRLPFNLKKELERKGTFARLRSAPSCDGIEMKDASDESLREELLLKQQELEFLKKITKKANGGR